MSLDKWLVPKKSKTSPAGKTLTADNFRPEGIEPVNVFMREVCQNILDARTKDIAGNLKPAVVNFKILKEGQDLDVGVINKYMGKLDPFIEASDLNDVYNNAKISPCVLLIEETDTIGLTGETTDSEFDLNDKNQRWNLFWHCEAKESKSGAELGRAGQGKITYNTTSGCGTVFAFTNQEHGLSDLLFGKCRFPSTFKKDGTYYLGHAFFCDHSGSGYDAQPLPIQDPKIINQFKDDFKLKRTHQVGTSWLIPYINDEHFGKEELIKALISEFYLSILKNDLAVTIQGTKVNAKNLRNLIKEYKVFKEESDENFANWLIDTVQKSPKCFTLGEKWYLGQNDSAAESSLTEVEINDARSRYSNFETIHFKVPISIHNKKDKEASTVYGDIYLCKIEANKTKEIYARDCLIIKEEQHLKRAPGKQFGAFIARDDLLNAFLGEADHASHVKWTPHNDRLTKNYNGYQNSLATVRNSMPSICRLIHNSEQTIYDDIFSDLISVPIKKGAKRKPTPVKPTPPIPPRPKPLAEYSLGGRDDTVIINNGPGFSFNGATKSIEIKFAYENFTGVGNAFDLYQTFEFDFEKFKNTDFKCSGCNILERDENWIQLEITEDDFEFSVKGFDPHEVRILIDDIAGKEAYDA